MSTGARRRVDVVLARPSLRFLAASVVASSLGCLGVVGCLWAMLHGSPAVPPSWLWLLGGTAASHFLAGVLAMVAWGWAR